MKLSINKLAAACSVALTGGTAHALTLSDFDAATYTVVYAGGATATDGVLENLARDSVAGYCANGNIDIFTAANERVITCNSAVAGLAGKLAFAKESQGGSSNGIVPLAAVAKSQAHDLRWLDMAALKTANGCTTVALLAADTGQAGLFDVTRRWNCALTLTPVDTIASATYDVNMGISDVNPALAYPAPSASDIAKLAVLPGVHVSFGVPVTQKLYTALQQAQGLTVGDGVNDVPSLTRAQLRGLFSGGIFDWNQIKDNSGVGLASSASVTSPPASTQIYLCRRVASSGTQATAEAYWLNQRCITGSRTFAEPNDGSSVDDNVNVTANVANGNVNAGVGSGNVRSCLSIYNTANVWGLGVLSNEVTAAQMVGFRFIKIDGVAPDLANTANGKYDFYSENVTTTIASPNPGFIDVSAATTSARGKLIRHIQTRIGQPTVLAGLNTTFAGRPWGDGGSMAIPSATAIPNAAPTTKAAMVSNPVDTSTKFGNNCNGAVTTKGTPAK